MKTAMTRHFTGMAGIRKVGSHERRRGCGEIGGVVHCWWENGPLLGKTWPMPEKGNVHLPYKPVVPLLGLYPREMRTCVHVKANWPMFTTALPVTARSNQMSTRE